MANLTRIKNNQITDSTILANTKIVPGSIVGSLFNANLTMTSDVTITGNLTVQGSSTYLTVASTNTYVNDPLIVLNNAFTGTNTYDIGLLINRGDQTTTALIWKEANKQFELTYTSDTGTSYGAINNSGYANLKVGNLTVAGITTLADIGAGNLTLTGDLAVNGGDITTTAATATVFNANATTVSAFGAATTLGIGAGTGTLTLNNATVTTPGQIISTRAGSATTGNGQIFLNGSTSNRIDWAAAGTGAPTFTTRTDGTKVVLYPALSGSTVDYAIGVDSATMWSSVPENGSSFNFKWYGAETLVANLSGTGNFTTVGDVAVNGGDLTTTAATFNLVNTDATTVNLAGAATALNLGTTTGTLTLRNPTVVGTETTQNVYNTTATTVNAFGAATTLIVGATTGIANIRNATTNVIGNATVGGTISVTGDATLTADLAVNGGDLTTSAGTFNLIDANATTVNFAGAATVIDLGATSGTLTINNPTVVGSQSTQALYNTTATTMNFAGAATTLIVGSATGVANIRNATTNILGNATVGGTLGVTGDATLTADLAVNGGDLTTSAGTFNLVNANATTVNFAGGATTLAVGATSGTLTINNPTVVGSQTTQAVFNTTATTVNAFGAASTLIVGATTGIANIRNATTNIIGNATVGGTLAITGDTTLTGDLAVNGGDITTTSATATVFNTNATTVDAFKAATDLEFGATSGTLTINNPTVVGSQTTQAVFNTTATTVNAFGAATTLIVGASTGVANIRNATTNVIGNATVGGTLGVTGNVTITGTLGVTAAVTLTDDLAVNGGDLTTTAGTFNLLNANAITVDAFKAATDLEFGATSGTLTINNPTVVGSQTTQNVYDTVATTVNAFGAASTMILGATTGVANIRNATTNIIGNATVGGTLGLTGDVTLAGDLAVNGGDITTTAGTFNLVNANATTVDAFKAATDLEFGATSGTLTINNPTVVGTQTTQNLYNTTATTLNIGGAATALNLGASTGNTTVQNNLITTGNIKLDATTQSTNTTSGALIVAGGVGIAKNLNVGGDVVITGNLQVDGSVTSVNTATLDVEDLNITVAKGAASSAAANGAGLTIDGANATILWTNATQSINFNKNIVTPGANFTGTVTVAPRFTVTSFDGNSVTTLSGNDITTSATTANLFNTTATTINFAGGATTLAVGANSGTITIGNPTLVGTQSTQAVYNTVATTVNAFGAATTLIVGATTGVANLRNATTNILGNATVGGTLAITGDTTLTGDLAVNGGDITTTATTATVFNTTATTVNAFGAATTANIGASTGTTTVNNNLTVGASGKLLTVNGSMIVEGGAYGNVTTTQYGAVYARSYGSNAYSIVQVKTNDNTTGMGMQAFTGANGLIYSNGGIEFKVGATVRDLDIPTGGTIYVTISNTGIVTLGNDIVSSTTTQNVFNTTATTVNAFGAATTMILGATTGTANIRNATTNILGNATVGGTLAVTGNATVTGILNVTGAVTLTDDLAVNGGDITTTAGTFNLVNANATTVDAFKAATDLEFGATSGTLTINNPTVVGSQTTQAVFNTTATTVNAFGAATTMILGATTGIANIRNATTNILGNTSILAETDSTSTDTGALIVAGGVGIAKTVHIGGNVYVNSGKRLAVGADLVSNVIYPEHVAQITSTANAYSRISIQNLSSGTHATSEFVAVADNGSNVSNYMVTGIAGSGYNEGIAIKAGDGYNIVNDGNLILASTGNDIKFSAGGLSESAIRVIISAANANVSILADIESDSTTTGALTVAGGAGIAKKLYVAGDTTLTSDLAVNGGDLTTTATTFNLLDATATTVNAFGAATTIDVGATSGTLTINNPTVVGSQSTQALYNTTATTLNFAGAATTLIVGATTGVANIRNATTNVIGNATVGGTLAVTGDTTLTGDLAVNGGDLTTTATTFNLLDATATTVNALGAATTIDLGATSGTLTINNPTVVGSQSTQNLYNTTATTLNFAGAATTLIVGSTTGIANIRNATTNVIGNATVGGTLDVSAGTTLNSTQTSGNFVVKGANTSSLIVANSTYGAVIIGGSNATPQLGATLKVNSSDSILVPVGSTADRPGNSGNVDVTGMMRYSTTVNALEFYNGTAWVSAGSDSTFTIITSEQFTGDGVEDTYTLSANTTTNGTMVSINGVVQIPTFSYSITVDQLVFTEVPATGDLIDVRILTTTQTAGSEVSSGNGFNTFSPTDADGAQLYSGTSAKTLRVTAAPDGSWAYKNGTKTTYNQTVTNIASAATPVIVDSFATASYTTAKYIVQTKNGSSVESMEAVLVQDGANAYVSIFGIVSSGSGLGTLSANIVSGNVKLYYTSTSVTNSNVKVYTTYIV